MAVQIVNMFLSIFQAAISMFFSLEITDGVSLGWIFIVVVIMFLLIRFFLSGGNEDG